MHPHSPPIRRHPLGAAGRPKPRVHKSKVPCPTHIISAHNVLDSAAAAYVNYTVLIAKGAREGHGLAIESDDARACADFVRVALRDPHAPVYR